MAPVSVHWHSQQGRFKATYNKLLFLLPGFLNYDLNLLVQSFHAVPEPRACRLGNGDSGNKRALWSGSLSKGKEGQRILKGP